MLGLSARLWNRVNFNGAGGCWLWTGGTQKGYGRIGLGDGAVDYVHRVSWRMLKGQIPDGRLVLHKCDVRSCVNPEHLFLGSAKDNSDDMISKGRQVVARGIRRAAAKLNDQKVREIRASKDSRSVLAARYGVHVQVISSVRHRKAWAHVE